jgi:hypothetical protein
MDDWLTIEDVAAWLDLPKADPADDGLVGATAGIKALVEHRRSDLDFTAADFRVVHADVVEGSRMWAGILYQSRSAPSGFAGYGDETTIFDPLGSRRAEVLRLVGWRRPQLA